MRAPRWHKGQGRGSLKAEDLNRLAEMAEAAFNMSVGPGLVINTVGGRRQLMLASSAMDAGWLPLTVVLTAPPVSNISTLTVRAVCYAQVPPHQDRPNCNDGLGLPCQYVWDGDDFEAYPDFGKTTILYASYYWNPVINGGPRLETPFLTAYSSRGQYIVQIPSAEGGTKAAIVRRIVNDGDRFVYVQEVIDEIVGGTWTGNYQAIGDEVKVNCWPGCYAYHYSPFVYTANPPGESLGGMATILPMLMVNGAWRILQHGKFGVVKLTGGVKIIEGGL